MPADYIDLEMTLRLVAVAAVVEALNHPAAERVTFSMPGVTVDRAMIAAVRKGIEDESITVTPGPVPAGADAIFSFDQRTILIGSGSMQRLGDRNTITNLFHEGLHAGQFLTNQYGFAWTREAAAYIGEALYFHHRFGDRTVPGSLPEKTRAIFELAGELARTALTRPKLTAEDVLPLERAVAAHGVYRNAVLTSLLASGVLR